MIMTPNPCIGCDKKPDCEFELLACMQFSNFVTYGRFSIDTPKYPTTTIYNKIFDDEMEIKQIWERKEFV